MGEMIGGIPQLQEMLTQCLNDRVASIPNQVAQSSRQVHRAVSLGEAVSAGIHSRPLPIWPLLRGRVCHKQTLWVRGCLLLGQRAERGALYQRQTPKLAFFSFDTTTAWA